MLLNRDIESSVHLLLYKMSRVHLACMYLTYTVLCSVVLIFGLFYGPVALLQHKVPLPRQLEQQSGIRMGPLNVQTPPLSLFNQEIWLFASVELAKAHGNGNVVVIFDASVQVSVPQYLLEKHELTSGILVQNKTVTAGEQNSIVPLGPAHTQHTRLKCTTALKCDDVFLLHLVPVDFTVYAFTVQFVNLQSQSAEELSEEHALSISSLTFRYGNYHFVYAELLLRFIFSILFQVITGIFFVRMRAFAFKDWTIEQKCLTYLLPLSILYNSPFYNLQFLTTQCLPQVMDNVFRTTFVCALLLAWLTIYHGIRVIKRRFCIFYMPKILIVTLVWLLSTTWDFCEIYRSCTDPTFDVHTDSAHAALVFRILLIILGVVYLLFLVVLIIRAFTDVYKLPFVSSRLCVLTGLTAGLLAASSIVYPFSVYFNSKLVEQMPGSSHSQSLIAFIAQWMGTTKASSDATFFYSLQNCLPVTIMINVYVFFLACICLPSCDTQREVHFKDNPSVSMINDSDEDVVYGHEADWTPLTAAHAS